MKKRILAGLLVATLAISGIMIMPKKAEAASPTSVYYDTEGTYQMSNYWSVESKKVPVKDGYVFGGWFELVEGTYTALKEENLTNDSVKSITAYAKFVPADVLSVKTQLATETSNGTTKAFLRLLSTTDSPDYQKVGFEYQLGSRAIAEKEMKKIYSAIRPSKSSSTILYPSDTFVNDVSKYFIALDVNNISESSFASIVYARAYWITADGTKVMGLARNNRVEDKQKDYISAGVTLLTDDIAPATVAAGKVVMTYNTTDFDVVVVDDSYKVDIGRVLSEMNYHVDETAGTITFVANAASVDKNVEADGLYANVRFVKKTNNNAASLNFEVKTSSTMFCDWLETVISTVSVQ